MSTLALQRRDQAIESLRARLTNVRKNARQEGQNLMRTAISGASGYALGMAEAKWGPDAVAGMSPSLAVGAVATAAAFLEIGGSDAAPYLRAVGDAGVAVFAFQKGFEHQQAREAEAQ